VDETLYSLPTVFALGLVFGMGPCTITCLPFLGPVFLAKSGGIAQSWKIILPFSMGRLASYTTLGILSGMAGALFKHQLGGVAVRGHDYCRGCVDFMA
jgi:thiol:disulfide interchange protein DsbD